MIYLSRWVPLGYFYFEFPTTVFIYFLYLICNIESSCSEISCVKAAVTLTGLTPVFFAPKNS